MIRHRKGFECTIAYYELPDDKYNSLIDLLSIVISLFTQLCFLNCQHKSCRCKREIVDYFIIVINKT